MQKKWRMLREGQRRSPRICALDVRKSRLDPVNVNVRKPHHFKGSRKKKKKTKLRPLQDVASPPSSPQDSSSNEQDDIHTNPEDLHINSELRILPSDNGERYDGWRRVTNPGQHYTMPFLPWAPDKQLFEFILDILQRRDTHEIFAEPVDPDEVEDYYEIIKEPMDFGTMRAKLHEGMYHSLEQFEHDVFLISRNAMHFNPSGTIYFRQARAIDELAKKVFRVLNTDPENFVTEFGGTRRRTNKQAKGEARCSTNGSSSKLAISSRSGSVTANISRKSMPSSSNSKLNLRTTKREIPGYSGSGINSQFDTIDDEVPFGGGFGYSTSLDADRRSSYEPQVSLLCENYSVVSPLYNTPKLLMLYVGYSESLMRFAKDLGPTAQMVAKRKLNGLFSSEANNYLSSGSINKYATSGISEQTSTMINKAATTKMSQNIHMGHRINMCDHANEQDRAYSSDRMRLNSVSFEPVATASSRLSFAADRFEAEAADISRHENWDHMRVGNIAGVSGFGQTVSTQYMRDPAAILGNGTDWRLKSRPVSDSMFGVQFLKT